MSLNQKLNSPETQVVSLFGFVFHFPDRSTLYPRIASASSVLGLQVNVQQAFLLSGLDLLILEGEGGFKKKVEIKILISYA